MLWPRLDFWGDISFVRFCYGAFVPIKDFLRCTHSRSDVSFLPTCSSCNPLVFPSLAFLSDFSTRLVDLSPGHMLQSLERPFKIPGATSTDKLSMACREARHGCLLKGLTSKEQLDFCCTIWIWRRVCLKYRSSFRESLSTTVPCD